MKTHVTLLALAVASLPVVVADVTGTWKAEVPVRPFNPGHWLHYQFLEIKELGGDFWDLQ